MQIIYTSGNYKRTIVKSIVAIVLGLVLVLWPTEVLNYTVKIIGAVFCVTGIISFLVSMRDQDERSARGLTSFNGIGSIILGILLWSMADFFTNMLMYLLGFILIVAGWSVGDVDFCEEIRAYRSVELRVSGNYFVGRIDCFC